MRLLHSLAWGLASNDEQRNDPRKFLNFVLEDSVGSLKSGGFLYILVVE
jgi:hypothetical protein